MDLRPENRAPWAADLRTESCDDLQRARVEIAAARVPQIVPEDDPLRTRPGLAGGLVTSIMLDGTVLALSRGVAGVELIGVGCL